MSRNSLIAFAISISICISISHAAILNVPEDFQTIQAGIASGGDGDTILVQPGVYEENISFNARPVVVGSLLLTTDDPAYIDSTIIDGGGEGAVVTFMPRNRGTLLRGFTIRNGNTGFGGGLYCRNESSETMEDLVVRDNNASFAGGGVYCNDNTVVTLRRIKFIGNSADETGGGASFNRCVPVVEECEFIDNSSPRFGAIHAIGSEVSFSRLLVTGNSCDEYPVISIFNIGQDQVAILDHLTIALNNSSEENYGCALGVFTEEGFSDVVLSNSIVWNNGDLPEIALVNVGGNACRLTASYNDIFEDQDEIAVGEGCQLAWGNGNISRDPLFIDAENGDYNISRQSPCIDAGDPQFERDPDGSRTDIGCFTLSRPDETWFGGFVYDWFGNPIEGAVVTGDFTVGEDFRMVTNAQGLWGNRVYFRRGSLVALNFEAAGYHGFTTERPLDSGPEDQSWISVRLHQSRFEPSVDQIASSLELGENGRASISFVNDGDAVTQWAASASSAGDAGLPPLSVRNELQVGQITNDDRIEGAAFTGERFYVARANGDGPNMICIFNKQGELRGSFRQPDTSGFGFRDLEWDGELIWGCNNGYIWGISPIGEVVHRLPDPFNPSTSVAYDPENDLFWVCGTTTRLQAMSREGRQVGWGLDRQGLRIYGLAWLENDPDGASLYILNKPADSRSRISKMNVTTGEVFEVGEFGNVDQAFKGISISNNFDNFRCSVITTILNRSVEDGGDLLQILQLNPNREWLTVQPSAGILQTGQRLELSVNLRTIGSNGSWWFDSGVYEGFIKLSTDAREGNFDIPVQLTVHDLAVDKPVEEFLPIRSEILAVYPQPFNANLTIDYALDKPSNVRIALYDPTGRVAISSSVEQLEAGIFRTILTADNLAAGVYLLKLEAGNTSSTKKVVLLK